MFKKIIAAFAAAAMTASVMAAPAFAQPVGISADTVSTEYPILSNSVNFSPYGLNPQEFNDKCAAEFGADNVKFNSKPFYDDDPLTDYSEPRSVYAPFILPGYGEVTAMYSFGYNENIEDDRITWLSAYFDVNESYDSLMQKIKAAFGEPISEEKNDYSINCKWGKVGIDNAEFGMTFYMDNGVVTTASAYFKPGEYTGGNAAASPKTPSIKTADVTFTKSAAANRFTIKWDEFGDADAYGIYLYSDTTKKYEFYKTVKGTKYTFNFLKKDTKYSFYVAALEKKDGKYYIKERSQAAAVRTKKS